ncbi:MAG: transposase [Phycisphaeraceae bacterium]
MTTILAIDLGKFKSVACIYAAQTGEHTFGTIPTTPAAMNDLIVDVQPDRVVIEVGPAAGWVKDLCAALAIPIQIANPNTEAWRWKNVKRKTDKDDGLKMARLSAMGQLPTVTLPSRGVRQWRALIAYRHTLVGRRTAIKNNVRSILDRQGLTHACGKSGWTQGAIQVLGELARPLLEADGDELWRGMVHVELEALGQVQQLIAQVETKLEALADADARVALLRTIPGVGPRLAETVVAMIDDPKRTRLHRRGKCNAKNRAQRSAGVEVDDCVGGMRPGLPGLRAAAEVEVDVELQQAAGLGLARAVERKAAALADGDGLGPVDGRVENDLEVTGLAAVAQGQFQKLPQHPRESRNLPPHLVGLADQADFGDVGLGGADAQHRDDSAMIFRHPQARITDRQRRRAGHPFLLDPRRCRRCVFPGGRGSGVHPRPMGGQSRTPTRRGWVQPCHFRLVRRFVRPDDHVPQVDAAASHGQFCLKTRQTPDPRMKPKDTQHRM